MLKWRRPRPRYGISDLVLRLNEVHTGHKFMIIRGRRWIRPNDQRNKQWVYDGVLIEASGDEIVVSTYISCVIESDLCRVTWHRYNQALLDPRHLKAAA